MMKDRLDCPKQLPKVEGESSEIHKRWQELREKLRAQPGWEVSDSKGFLKKATFTCGGERLQEEIQLAQGQQQLEDEQRAFSEMLERNNEE